jgi:phage terminase large subunit-like protein
MEQGKVHHVGVLESLEAQLTNFGYTVEPEHDDELDAHVYTILELMEEEQPLLFARLGG